MSVVQVVTDNSNDDMQDDVYSWYAEDNKGNQGLHVHLSVQKPNEREAKGRPVPCDAESFGTRQGERREFLKVEVCIGADKGPGFVRSDAVGACSMGRR